MPEMVSLEKTLCRSAPWRLVARKVVLPWALQRHVPSGDALEIGAGAGVVAAELLRSHPDLRLTVTDYDDAMLSAGRDRLEAFGSRVAVETADATDLPFADESFDHVFSFIMLHHVLDWESAIGESLRVLKPGGWLIGYDILESRLFQFLHRLEGAHVRPMRTRELSVALESLPTDLAILMKAGGAPLLRFRVRKRRSPSEA